MTRSAQVLAFGGGVQSTTLYLMAASGEVLPGLNAAIFADTGDEPQAVYQHLRWLAVGDFQPPIMAVSKGRLSKDLRCGINTTGQRFASIPAFTISEDRKQAGMLRRQCSKEYKSEVMEEAIRRRVLGLEPGRAVPAGVEVVEWFGISLDEAARADRIAAKVDRRGWRARFPLIELQMSRRDCQRWLEGRVPYEVQRSACVFCPYQSDREWVHIRNVAQDWQLAVEVDAALRQPGAVANRGLDQPLYVHRSCRPLDEVLFNPRAESDDPIQLLLRWECVEGVCGV